MKLWLNCIIVAFVCLWRPWLYGQEEWPFWRKKQELFIQMTQQQRIVVSAVSSKLQGDEKIRVLGAGVVKAGIGHTTGLVVQFEKLPQISPYFKKVVHKPKKKQVYLFIEAFGYQSRILLQYRWVYRNSQKAQLDWQVVWGRLQGMVGHFQFRSLPDNKTEVSLWASLNKEKIPLPWFLQTFTLEVITEKVARKMRAYIESTNLQNNKRDPIEAK